MNINFDISPIKILMILYLLTLTNGSLIKHNNLTYMIENNNIIKHITIIIAIAVILSLFYNGLPIVELLFYSFIIYIIYILTLKIDKKYVLIFGLLLTVVYFIDYYNKHNITLIKEDKNINHNKKDGMIKKIDKKNIMLLSGFIVLVICGSIQYDNKKNTQYGGGYSISKFLNL